VVSCTGPGIGDDPQIELRDVAMRKDFCMATVMLGDSEAQSVVFWSGRGPHGYCSLALWCLKGLDGLADLGAGVDDADLCDGTGSVGSDANSTKPPHDSAFASLESHARHSPPGDVMHFEVNVDSSPDGGSEADEQDYLVFQDGGIRPEGSASQTSTSTVLDEPFGAYSDIGNVSHYASFADAHSDTYPKYPEYPPTQVYPVSPTQGSSVRVVSRSISPRWGLIRFRPLTRTYPCGPSVRCG